MSVYGIEFNDRVKSVVCPHCGEESITVWGWVSKDNIGGWGEEDNLGKRQWAFIEARPIADRYEMMVRDPEESLYTTESFRGKPLSRSEVLASELAEEFFAVADFIAFNDPAVKSYLSGKPVSSDGRKEIAP
jgi:hypothetical protein